MNSFNQRYSLNLTTFFIVAQLILLSCSPINRKPPARAIPGLYFIDAHSQMDHNVDQEHVISLMDRGGVYRTILSNHLQRPWSEIIDFAKKKPNRIIPAVRIKGEGFHWGDSKDFYERLTKQMGDSNFRAMAEVHLWHDGAGKYREIKTDFNDELIQAAFQNAHRKSWPFVIHIEFASLPRADYLFYMKNLQKFLRKYPKHPFVMIHMAQLEAGPVRKLLDAHSNLYFMTSHASPYYVTSKKPFIDMFKEERLKPQWKKLISEKPDRFIFALDNVFAKFWTPYLYLGKMELWWNAIGELPDTSAHALAHGNAERLWKLPPKP